MSGSFPFYEPIRKAIVHAFQNELLTPTRNGQHAPATKLFRGPADIAKTLDDQDFAVLLGGEHTPPLWAANPPPDSQREENFLKSLEIPAWGWAELARSLSWLHGNDRERIEKWIWQKDDHWLLRFYALLGDASGSPYNKFIYVNDLRIVRVESDQGDEHVISKKAFFRPAEETLTPSDIYFVKSTVYNVGRSEPQKKAAVSFLNNIGVDPFDDKASIELRLARYDHPPSQIQNEHYTDLKNFIAYWKKYPTNLTLFSNYTFLIGASVDGQLFWKKPSDLCLDIPYQETGLAEMVHVHKKHTLWDEYNEKLDSSIEKDFTDFVTAVGIMNKLDIAWQSTWKRGHCYLHYDYSGSTRERNPINNDYTIAHLEKYLLARSIPLSRLIWDAITRADRKVAIAEYAPNSKFDPRSGASQLVLHLKSQAWIPDKTGEFRSPQDMTKEDLRPDFPYDERNGLLNAIGFGETARKRSEEYQNLNQTAQYVGFNSAEELEKWRKVKELGISPDELLAQHVNRQKASQPEESVSNPERRRKGVLERRENAPTRESVTCERSIQPGAKLETLEAKAYLRAKYLNPEGQLVCQCCHEEMPFKVRDAHYFEAIQCIRHLDRHHFENRLALCPTCAAMYQHARETDDTDLHHRITEHDAPDTASFTEISVILAGSEFQLRFVGTHWFDLKTILSK